MQLKRRVWSETLQVNSDILCPANNAKTIIGSKQLFICHIAQQSINKNVPQQQLYKREIM